MMILVSYVEVFIKVESRYGDRDVEPVPEWSVWYDGAVNKVAGRWASGDVNGNGQEAGQM